MVSQKTIPEKMFIRENDQVLIIDSPDGYKDLLKPLPAGARILQTSAKPVNILQVFIRNRLELEAKLDNLARKVKPDGWLWITYPKGTSKIQTDINRDIIWQYAKTIGLRAVHQMSIDSTWSAMRFSLDINARAALR